MSNSHFQNLKKISSLCLALTLFASQLNAQNTVIAPPVDTATPGEATISSNESLRAYLQLQEQIHVNQLAIEQNREAAQIVAAQNAEALSNRLQSIADSLMVQHAREMADRQQTDHLLLLAAGLFALLGFAAMLLTAYFQWRAIHRLTEISMALPVRGLGQLPSVDTLDLNGNQLLTASAGEESNNRLFNIIERLETRISELEEAARSPLKEHASDSVPPIAGHNAEASELLLGQGQSLLNSNQPEEAIVCFDKILAMNANNVEALVKKGSALEKLRKPTEAIECYDRAIAADSSLTIAYLQKGGLYNRMERFNDAMKCYEQALHAGEKTQSVS